MGSPLALKHLQDLLQLHSHLPNDLLAAVKIIVRLVTFQLLAGAADGETLLIQQAADLANHDHVAPLVITPITSSFDRLELFKLLFPIPQNMRLDPAELADFANRLFDEVGLNKREAKEFVDAYFEAIREALEGGENVKLSGFGNFQLRDKDQRPGRNPKTGEEIPISARRVVTFRPGQKLRARVEAYVGSGD